MVSTWTLVWTFSNWRKISSKTTIFRAPELTSTTLRPHPKPRLPQIPLVWSLRCFVIRCQVFARSTKRKPANSWKTVPSEICPRTTTLRPLPIPSSIIPRTLQLTDPEPSTPLVVTPRWALLATMLLSGLSEWGMIQKPKVWRHLYQEKLGFGSKFDFCLIC